MNNNPFNQFFDLLKNENAPLSFYLGKIEKAVPLEIKTNDLPLYSENLYIPRNAGVFYEGDIVLLAPYDDQKYILLGVIK